MGFSIGEDFSLILIVLGLGLLIFFLRRGHGAQKASPEVVHSLLSEVRLNQALVEIFSQGQKPKKFEVVNWQINKAKIGFLSQSLRNTLSDTFGMAEDFNHQIKLARKSKSANYIASINIDKLKELLTKSRQGLEEWLLINTGRKDLPVKYPSFFDSFFGTGS